MNKKYFSYANEIASILRKKNINTEIYSDPNKNLGKQLTFANKKGNTNPRAAIEVSPTHLLMSNVSISIYNDWTDIPSIIGIDNFQRAFLGFSINSFFLLCLFSIIG